MNRHCPLLCTPSRGSTPVITIIRDVSRETGIPTALILSDTRQRPVVIARHAAIKAVYAAKPWLSSPQIARMFGMDHTSILFALGKLKKKPSWMRL